jgi:exosome complex RNA-binding protein Csl4
MEDAFPRGKLDKPSAVHLNIAGADDHLFGSGRSAKHKSSTAVSGKGDGKKRSHSEGRQQHKKKSPAGTDGSETGISSGPHKADELSFKRLRPGTVVLARVRRVAGDQVTLSLPHGLTAQCRASDVNDIMSDLVRSSASAGAIAGGMTDSADVSASTALLAALPVGLLVRAVVTNVGSESMFSDRSSALQLAASLGARLDAKSADRRILASLRPELTNQGLSVAQLRTGSLVSGYVSSVEDHGYVVALGIQGISAFLPFSGSDGTAGQAGTVLSPGTPLWATVSEVNRDANSVTLACSASHVSGARAKEATHTLYTVKPGMRVVCTVDRVLQNGLSVSFMAFFEATLHLHHLPRPATSMWQQAYKPGQEFAARILYVDVVDKIITVSAAPHIVSLGLTLPSDTGGAPDSLFGIGGPMCDAADGDIVPCAVVLRVDIGAGMLLGWGGGEKSAAIGNVEKRLDASAQWGRTAYVHISRVADEKVEHIEKLYRPGSVVAARLLGSAGIEGHAHAATKASVVQVGQQGPVGFPFLPPPREGNARMFCFPWFAICIQAAVLRASDVIVGAVLEGVVESVTGDDSDPAGKTGAAVDFASGKGVVAVVRLGEGVKALITVLHAADVLPKQAFATSKARKAFFKGAGLIVGAKVCDFRLRSGRYLIATINSNMSTPHADQSPHLVREFYGVEHPSDPQAHSDAYSATDPDVL